MTFQVSDYKGRNFFDLNNNDNQPICWTYSKGGVWLKHLGLSNSMCAHVTRLIMNHVPIGKYWLKFFPKEFFACMCRECPIEMRRHILFDCARYKKSWNSKRESLKGVLMFLEFNLRAFCFQEGIT